MNMTTLREKSKVFMWVVLIGFLLSLVGVMGTSGGGFLGGASLTSFFSTTVNTNLNVGKIGNKEISINSFRREWATQRNIPNQFNINREETNFIGTAWNTMISNIIKDKQIKKLNLKTKDKELKSYLINTPPSELQNFLMQYNLFKSEDGSFNLEEYQNVITNNLQWVPDSLMDVIPPTLSFFESNLKTRSLPQNKLISLYSKLTSIPNNQIKNEIINSKTTCNIDVLTIEFDKMNDSLVLVTEKEINKYYNDNKSEKFKLEESTTLDYIIYKNIENTSDSLEVILNDSLRQEAINFSMDAQPDIMSFYDAINEYQIAITDTINIIEFFDNLSGIPRDMGYNRNIVRFAFDNPIGSVSDRFSTNNGNVVFHIIKKNNESFKTIDEVSEEITSFLLNEKKKEIVKSNISKLLEKNSSLSDIVNIYSNYCSLTTNEEATISGSFKTPGKNYKIMGNLSAMEDGNTSNIIEEENKFYIIKLNKKDVIDEEEIMKNYELTRKRLLSTQSRSIYNGWENYKKENINIVDLRHKAI